MTRASIDLRKKVFSEKMDHRVKPGDDDFEEHIRPSTGDVIDLTGKSPKSVSSPSRKIFPLLCWRKSLSYPPRPARSEGRFAIVTDVRRDAVDAGSAFDERRAIADGEVVWS